MPGVLVVSRISPKSSLVRRLAKGEGISWGPGRSVLPETSSWDESVLEPGRQSAKLLEGSAGLSPGLRGRGQGTPLRRGPVLGGACGVPEEWRLWCLPRA